MGNHSAIWVSAGNNSAIIWIAASNHSAIWIAGSAATYSGTVSGCLKTREGYMAANRGKQCTDFRTGWFTDWEVRGGVFKWPPIRRRSQQRVLLSNIYKGKCLASYCHNSQAISDSYSYWFCSLGSKLHPLWSELHIRSMLATLFLCFS